MSGLRLWPLYVAAIASGWAALLFELLLFRRMELLLGRSVTASAIILAGYMAGLGLGAYLAARPRWFKLRPTQAATAYLLVEISAGVAAFSLLAVLPQLYHADSLSLATGMAMLVLLLPTLAMGMAMPFLCGVGLRRGRDFQQGFNRLYAANTLGAMLGVSGGFLLMQAYGIPVAGYLALAANLLAGLLVFFGRPNFSAKGAGTRHQDLLQALDRFKAPMLSRTAVLILTGFCGFIVLALEVIWMRALLMHFRATPGLFPLVVGLVIGGISLGAMLSKRLDINAWLLCAGFAAAAGCAWLTLWPQLLPLAPTAAFLCLPVSLASGALFTRCVLVWRQHSGNSVQAAAQLYLINTLMAAVGALAAAWLFLPVLGLGRAWLICALGFAIMACWIAPRRLGLSALILMLVAALAWLDPSKVWADKVLHSFARYQRAVAVVTATDATLQLAQRKLAGQSVAWRLMTDGYSMSGSEFDSLRYMRLFAQLPQALHQQPEQALLISYGIGNTAAALLADQRLRRLDVVDTSSASVALSREVYRQDGQVDPLHDPRVQLHIDDGRHLLLKAQRRWDLITAEPPPPRLAGVVNLYTQEYFELIHQRLRPGGLTTHWLPVDQLSRPASAAIVRSFCAVFSDCSLWLGSHYNWILLGGREAASMHTHAADPLFQQDATRKLLREVGFERPSQLATSFLADAQQLATWVGEGDRLDDDHPGRLDSRPVTASELQYYFVFADDQAAQQRFEQSDWAAGLWTPALRAQALQDWLWQPILAGQVKLKGEPFARASLAALNDGLRMPVLRLAGLSLAELSALAQNPSEQEAWVRGFLALLNGQHETAVEWLQMSTDPRATALLQCLTDRVCAGP